jgi:hypothetical protein
MKALISIICHWFIGMDIRDTMPYYPYFPGSYVLGPSCSSQRPVLHSLADREVVARSLEKSGIPLHRIIAVALGVFEQNRKR